MKKTYIIKDNKNNNKDKPKQKKSKKWLIILGSALGVAAISAGAGVGIAYSVKSTTKTNSVMNEYDSLSSVLNEYGETWDATISSMIKYGLSNDETIPYKSEILKSEDSILTSIKNARTNLKLDNKEFWKTMNTDKYWEIEMYLSMGETIVDTSSPITELADTFIPQIDKEIGSVHGNEHISPEEKQKELDRLYGIRNDLQTILENLTYSSKNLQMTMNEVNKTLTKMFSK